jgi:hypothetical protein
MKPFFSEEKEEAQRNTEATLGLKVEKGLSLAHADESDYLWDQ